MAQRSARSSLFFSSFSLVVALVAAGCSPTDGQHADTGTPGVDAGSVVDSGSPVADAGHADAGTVADAGPADSGTAADAGPADAGTVADAGLGDAGEMLTDAGSVDGGSTADGGVVLDAGSPVAIATAGIFQDQYGDSDIAVSDRSWSGDTVISYDNATGIAITQTSVDSAYNPGLYNKTLWAAGASGSFWFCMADYALSSAPAALASTKMPDATSPPTDLNGTGCGGYPWTQLTPQPYQLAIAGVWQLNGGSQDIAITDTHWAGSAILSFDNTQRSAVTQSPGAFPSFNKVTWTAPANGSFYFCVVDPGLATEVAAHASTATADATSPATGGCGTSPWTKLSTVSGREPAVTQPPVRNPVSGLWQDQFGDQDIAVSDFSWSGDTLVSFDVGTAIGITQTSADSAYNPGLYNKVVWVAGAAGSFWSCTVDYALPTLAAAQASTKTADATDPANSGCGSFSWSQLAPEQPMLGIAGIWKLNGSPVDIAITDTYWAGSTILSFDNTARSAVTQSPTSYPSFNKVVWTAPVAGSFYYCVVDPGLATSAAATASTATADSTTPATSGCGTSPWTSLSSD